MFRTLIYFDKNKVLQYKSLIEGKKAVEINKVKVSNEKSGKGQIYILSGGISGKSEMEGAILENYLFDCEEFEKLLEGRDDYFDFTENDYDLETVSKSSIIKFNGTFNIPEQFDAMDLINQFRSLLIDTIETESKEEQEVLKCILGKESTKIPIFLEFNESNTDRLGYSKINPNHLCCNFNDIEDDKNEDVTIIAKVISRKNIDGKPIVVYDVMKDFLSLSRAFRRQVDEKIEGVEDITIDEDFITLEILAIYQ